MVVVVVVVAEVEEEKGGDDDNKHPLLQSKQKYIKQCNFTGSKIFLLLLLLRCTGCDIIWLGGNKRDQIRSHLDVNPEDTN